MDDEIEREKRRRGAKQIVVYSFNRVFIHREKTWVGGREENGDQ